MMRIEFTSHLVHAYFNIYILKSLFFGYGVVRLSAMEEMELKKTCKIPMLNKLGLSSKLPREVMWYMQATVLSKN